METIKIALFYADKRDENATQPLELLMNADPRLIWKSISASEIRQGKLKDFDVVVFPGGNAREQAEDLRPEGKKAIRDFVEDGGGYIGICAGGFLATTNTDYGISLVNVSARAGYRHVPNEGLVSMTVRGVGEVGIQWTPKGKDLLGGCTDNEVAQFSSGPIFSNAHRVDLGKYVTLANYSSEVSIYDFQKGEMLGPPAIVLAPYGKGLVILSGSHFEFDEKNDLLMRRLLRGVSREAGTP